jgi:PT repeat
MKTFIRLAALAVIACLAVTGCGGGGTAAASSSAPAATGAATASGGTSAKLSAFDTCLKAHGVKITARRGAFPSGTARPTAFPTNRPTAFPTNRPTAFPTAHRSGAPGGFLGGADSAAFKACAKYAPAGFGGRFGGGAGAGISASAFTAFKSCMSQNGVKITGTAQTAMRSLRTATGKTATAFKTCGVLLQTGSGSPSPSPST